MLESTTDLPWLPVPYTVYQDIPYGYVNGPLFYIVLSPSLSLDVAGTLFALLCSLQLHATNDGAQSSTATPLLNK